MAYRRSLTTGARLFIQQRFTPSISYVNHYEDRKNQHSDDKAKSFLQTRSYNIFRNYTNTLGIYGVGCSGNFRDPTWSPYLIHQAPMGISGLLLARNISTEASAVVSEVAVAAADSWPPVAAMQYAIDGVHNFTGFNWWSSIVITTLITMTLRFSIDIHMLRLIKKSESPYQLPTAHEKKIGNHAVTCLTLVFAVTLSSLFAIVNMVEKVPSFKTGGPGCFMDLTTADYFVLPWLTLFSYWLKEQEGLDNSSSDQDKLEAKLIGYFTLLVPVMPFIPKALYFPLITSYLFSFAFELFVGIPRVRKFLNI